MKTTTTPRLTLVTSNDDKWREAERILRRSIARAKLELPEIQAATTAEVALHKARAAFEMLKTPVIVEDAGVELPSLGGFPGPFIKYWETLGGLDSICRAADGLGDRRVVAICALAVCGLDDSREAFVITGESKGTIADRPRGTNGFGWDAIFIPESDPALRTFGEMSSEEKDQVSHRRRAWEKLAATLRSATSD